METQSPPIRMAAAVGRCNEINVCRFQFLFLPVKKLSLCVWNPLCPTERHTVSEYLQSKVPKSLARQRHRKATICWEERAKEAQSSHGPELSKGRFRTECQGKVPQQQV